MVLECAVADPEGAPVTVLEAEFGLLGVWVQGLGFYRGISGLYRDDGKSNGNYYLGFSFWGKVEEASGLG